MSAFKIEPTTAQLWRSFGQTDSTIGGHPCVGRRFTFPTYGLLRHARTGRGATLDVSMLECLIAADDIT